MLDGRAIANTLDADSYSAEAFTHEQYLHRTRDIVIGYARLNAEDSDKLRAAKLVYGAGSVRGARGVCFHNAWHKARVACDEFLARCERCGSVFERVTVIERRATKRAFAAQ